MADGRLAFTFHRCLGEGGYGEVYLATQHTDGGIQRDVAVKVLREPFDDDADAVKRLRDEGQALALLSHPAIVGVHQFARIDDRLALVMEYIEGADLSYYTDKERLLPERVVVEAVREVAEALAHALEVSNPLTGRPLGMIHRDIKPANVRFSVDGKVKLLDFGVARSEEMKRRARTAMGEVLLTPGFGAPEALGFGVTGPAVDVFALGVSMFELLVGEPFYGKTDLKFQVALALDSEDFNQYLGERLELVANETLRAELRKMLSFTHEHRPTAAQVADTLDGIWRGMDGPTVGKWARTTQFPDLSYDTTALCGRRVDGEGVVLGAKDVAAPATAAPQRPPPKLGGPPPPPGADRSDLSPAGPVPSVVPPPPRGLRNTLDVTQPAPDVRVMEPPRKPTTPPPVTRTQEPPASSGSSTVLLVGGVGVAGVVLLVVVVVLTVAVAWLFL